MKCISLTPRLYHARAGQSHGSLWKKHTHSHYQQLSIWHTHSHHQQFNILTPPAALSDTLICTTKQFNTLTTSSSLSDTLIHITNSSTHSHHQQLFLTTHSHHQHFNTFTWPAAPCLIHLFTPPTVQQTHTTNSSVSFVKQHSFAPLNSSIHSPSAALCLTHPFTPTVKHTHMASSSPSEVRSQTSFFENVLLRWLCVWSPISGGFLNPIRRSFLSLF